MALEIYDGEAAAASAGMTLVGGLLVLLGSLLVALTRSDEASIAPLRAAPT